MSFFLVAGFLHVTGTGTRSDVHLPCQERSGCPMDGTSVLLILHAGPRTIRSQTGVKLSRDSAVCVWSWLPEDAAKHMRGPLPTNKIGFIKHQRAGSVISMCLAYGLDVTSHGCCVLD